MGQGTSTEVEITTVGPTTSAAASSSTIAWLTNGSVISALNRGPITTLFAPPTSCTATLTQFSSDSPDLAFGRGFSYLNQCYLLGTMQAADWRRGMKSSAICPSGYAVAATFDDFLPETSAALCCPTGYSYYEGWNQCNSTITQDQTIDYISPINNDPGGWGRGLETTSEYTAGSSAWGDGVPIWWQSSDLEVVSAAYTKTPAETAAAITSNNAAQTSQAASVVAPTSTTAPTAPSTAPGLAATSSTRPGFSQCTKARVDIGIYLDFFGVIAFAVFLF